MSEQPPCPDWKASTTIMQVPIKWVPVVVPCWVDADGEIFLDDRATDIIERVKNEASHE